MGEYNGKGDPGEHVQLINNQLNYFHADKSFECKLFMLTLIGSPNYGSMLCQTKASISIPTCARTSPQTSRPEKGSLDASFLKRDYTRNE